MSDRSVLLPVHIRVRDVHTVHEARTGLCIPPVRSCECSPVRSDFSSAQSSTTTSSAGISDSAASDEQCVVLELSDDGELLSATESIKSYNRQHAHAETVLETEVDLSTPLSESVLKALSDATSNNPISDIGSHSTPPNRASDGSVSLVESEDEDDPVPPEDFEQVYGKDYADYLKELQAMCSNPDTDWSPAYEV